MLRAILMFLAERFGEGGELQEAPPLTDGREPVEDLLFYTDAKATDTGAWIGGFKQDSAGNVVFFRGDQSGLGGLAALQKGPEESDSHPRALGEPGGDQAMDAGRTK